MNDNAQTTEPRWICDSCKQLFTRTQGTPHHEQDQFGICHRCNTEPHDAGIHDAAISFGIDSGGHYVEWYRDDDNNSGNGDNARVARWYAGPDGLAQDCRDRAMREPPFDGWLTMDNKPYVEPSFDHAFENAIGMFWDTLARFYPEVETGDIEPYTISKLQTAADDAARMWLANNHPDVPDGEEFDDLRAWQPPAPKSKKPTMPAALRDLARAVEANPLMPDDFDHHSDERRYDEARSLAEEDIADEADKLLDLYADAPQRKDWEG